LEREEREERDAMRMNANRDRQLRANRSGETHNPRIPPSYLNHWAPTPEESLMTPNPHPRSQLLIGLALAGLMAATRGQAFAPLGQHLPDASLAVFFMAGFYLRPAWAFAALFGLGSAIDLIAVGWGGVSAYCLSPAYWLLVPACGTLWAAGRWYRTIHRPDYSTIPRLGALLLGAGALAEAFASGGFYLFSGRFEPSLLGFGYSLVSYLPGTLGALLAYVCLGALVHVGLGADRRGAGVGR
jgi:hypothetical protein